MIELRKRLSKLAACVVGLFFFSCVQNDYDLSKGLNTTVSIGGDSLAMPIGKTDKVLLSSVLSGMDILMASNSEYSIVRKDSLKLIVDALKPISFAITPPAIPAVEMNFTDVVLPSFQLSEIALDSPLPIPDVDVAKSILPINLKQLYSYPIPDANMLQLRRVKREVRSPKATRYTLLPVLMKDSGSVEQRLTLNTYPLQVKRVNSITLSNNRVKIVFDWSQIRQLNLTTTTQSIQRFRVDFPAEYVISSPVGAGSRIEENSFIVENAAVSPELTEATYYLNVDYIALDKVVQNGSLDFVRDIPYKVEFAYDGETDDLPSLKDKSIDLTVKITSDPVISDLFVETNTINVADDAGSYSIHKNIATVPHEIQYVSQLNFKDGAYLQIQIDKPDIAPFTFTGGYCEIQLPSMFRFKRNIYLDPTTNKYRLPYSSLFGIHRLPLVGAVVNKAYPETGGDIVIEDQIDYKVTGFKLAPTGVSSSQVAKMNNRKYNFKFTTNLVNIDNAILETREVNTQIPDQRSVLKVNRFISSEVQKIYSASMANLVKATLHLDVIGLPASIDSLFFRNYTIKLPPFLKFVAGTTNFKNEVILNRGFKVSEGFTKVLELERLDFGADGLNLDRGYLNINDSILFSGSVYVKGVNLKSSDIGTVKVEPSLSIDEISLGMVEGKFTPNIAPMKQTVVLDLPAYLMDDSVKLDVSNPVVMVKADNTLGIPVDVDVTMTPKRKGTVLTDAVIRTNLLVDPALKPGESTTTNFWLATTSEGQSPDYKLSLLPNLNNLLKKVPDEIMMDMKPTVVSDHHKVDLARQNNQISVKYDVHIPMTFGANFKIAYQDTIAGLNSRLSQLLDYTNTLSLMAEVENQIPLELKMEIIPLDVHKKRIDGVSISQLPKLLAGVPDPSDNSSNPKDVKISSQKTKVVVGITETKAGALKNVDAFLISVFANRNSTIAGLPLREDQYFLIDLKILIPNGLSVTLRK